MDKIKNGTCTAESHEKGESPWIERPSCQQLIGCCRRSLTAGRLNHRNQANAIRNRTTESVIQRSSDLWDKNNSLIILHHGNKNVCPEKNCLEKS